MSSLLGLLDAHDTGVDQESQGTCPHGAGSLLGETDPEKLTGNHCVNTHILVVIGGDLL